MHAFQVHSVEGRFRGRRGLFDNNDDDGLLVLNHMVVDLWRVDRDHLLRLLLVLFNDLDDALRSGLHLHTIHLSGNSLNLWFGGLFNGLLGLLAMSVKVVLILKIPSVLDRNTAGDVTHSSPLCEPLELPLQLREDRT